MVKKPVVGPIEVKKVYRKKSVRGNLKAYEHQRQMILQKVSNLYLQGKTQWEIAQSFNPPVSQKCISERLAEVRKVWRESATMDFNARKEQELAKIDRLETEAFDAWEQSKKDSTVKKVVARALRKAEEDGDAAVLTVVSKINETVSKAKSGNPAFLAQVERCIEMRCRIFGISKTPDVTLNQTNNTMNVVAPSWDALFARPEPPDPVLAKLQEVERLPALREAVLVEDRS